MLDEWALPYLNPRKLGAKMDGTTDDVPGATTCLAYIGTTPAAVMIDRPMRLASAFTWPANVQLHFAGEGQFIYDTPLTIMGSWLAGPQKIFAPTNASGTLAGRPRIREMHPEWFGAPANGTDDDAPATLRAFLAAAAFGYLPVRLGLGPYRWGQQIPGGGTGGMNFKGCSLLGTPGTIVNCAGLGAGVSAIKYRGGSGQMCKVRVMDIEFQGDSDTVCVEFAGQGGAKAIFCRFGISAEGLRLHNLDVGHFTEYSTAEACQFDDACALHVTWMKTNGSDSFHGSGLAGRCRSNRTGTRNVGRIAPGCKVYNAPIDVQVWGNGTGAVIQNDSTKPTLLHGVISFEVPSPNTLVLGAGNAIDFVGDILGTGEGCSAGTLTQVEAAIINADESMTAMGSRKSYEANVTTGANTLPSSFPGKHREVWLQIEAPNYDYRYYLSVDHNGYGQAGKVTVLSNDSSVNNAGYGPPALTVDTTGHLVLTNPSWPASGIQCVYSELDQSAGMLQEHHTQAM